MEEIKLYEGKETLFFDQVAHQYFWNDEQLPSATGITKLLTPANVIGMWSAKICSEEFKKLMRAGVRILVMPVALGNCSSFQKYW